MCTVQWQLLPLIKQAQQLVSVPSRHEFFAQLLGTVEAVYIDLAKLVESVDLALAVLPGFCKQFYVLAV